MTSQTMNTVGQWYERPWGRYKTVAISDNHYQLKIIQVNPGGRLSLQKHAHRSEHWVVVTGLATITIGEVVNTHPVGDHVFIPKETPHRLENRSSMLVEIAEIQLGDYLGEDDIVRLDDVYGRVSSGS